MTHAYLSIKITVITVIPKILKKEENTLVWHGCQSPSPHRISLLEECLAKDETEASLPYLFIIVQTIINSFGKFLGHFDSGDIISCSVVLLDGGWRLSDYHDLVNILIIDFII